MVEYRKIRDGDLGLFDSQNIKILVISCDCCHNVLIIRKWEGGKHNYMHFYDSFTFDLPITSKFFESKRGFRLNLYTSNKKYYEKLKDDKHFCGKHCLGEYYGNTF